MNFHYTFFLISYGLLLVSLLSVPESFWDAFLQFWERGAKGIVLHLKQQKKRLPFLGEIMLGEGLLLGMQDAEAKIALGLKILPGELLRYKFYTDLLESLLESYRRLGSPIKKILPDIRRGLTRDLQFERKILNESLNALLQFAVLALTTWGFVVLSSLLVEVSPSRWVVVLMILLQAIGVFLFFHLMAWIKKKSFTDFCSAIKELYLFSALLEVGLPLNEVLKRSRILEGRLIQSDQFSPFRARTKNLIARMKETGLSPRDEVQEMIQGLWHFQDENFEKFTKKVQVLKFAVLAFFFLPAYFLYLYSIFQFFMEQ